MLGAIINKDVYVWQREVVFWTGPIEIPVVDTDSYLPIFLRYWPMLVNLVDSTTLRTLALTCLVTSFLIFRLISGLNFLSFCFTGGHVGSVGGF